MDTIELDKPKVVLLTGKNDESKKRVFNYVRSLLDNDYEVHWLTNKLFFFNRSDFEFDVTCDNFFVHQVVNIENELLELSKKFSESNNTNRIFFIDRFTGKLSVNLIFLWTLLKKRCNTSVVFISHTTNFPLHLSNRLRECLDYNIDYT